MGELSFREATRADLPVIVALLADDQLATAREDAREPLDPGYLAAFDALAADPNQSHVVAERDGAVIGTMQLSFLPGLSYRGAWRGQIEAVRVARELRGHGIGAAMIAWAVDRCRERGCRLVQLTSHTDREAAHRFYRRLGFAQSHAGFKLAL